MKYWSIWLVVFVIVWLAFYFSLASKPIELFQSNWPMILIGFAGALLGNISAVGGGIIFIPAMMFIFHLDPVVSLKVALTSQCFGMTSGAIGWYSRQKIPKILFLITIPSLLLGSTVSSLIVHPSPLLIKLFFGPISISIGIITLISTKIKNENGVTELRFQLKDKIYLAFAAFVGGLITGWVAIGEGEIVSAFLMVLYQVQISLSIALGVILLAVNSIYLALIHQFVLGGLPWDIAAFTGLGCVFGARLAPFLGQKLHSKTLKYVFAFIAIADGSLFVFQYFFLHK